MKVNATALKNSGIQAVSVAGGFAGAHVASKFIPANMEKFSSPGMLVLGVLGASLVKEPAVKSACAGVAAYGAISTANQFLQPAEGETPTGIKAIASQYLPSLNGAPSYSMGYLPYDESSVPGMLGMGYAAGSEWEGAPYQEEPTPGMM